MNFNEILKKFLKPEMIKFTKHFESRSQDRGISKDMVVQLLLSDKLLYSQYQQATGTYKLTYSLSGTYSIVIVVAIDIDEVRVVTVIKSNKKIKKRQEKAGASIGVFRKRS